MVSGFPFQGRPTLLSNLSILCRIESPEKIAECPKSVFKIGDGRCSTCLMGFDYVLNS